MITYIKSFRVAFLLCIIGCSGFFSTVFSATAAVLDPLVPPSLSRVGSASALRPPQPEPGLSRAGSVRRLPPLGFSPSRREIRQPKPRSRSSSQGEEVTQVPDYTFEKMSDDAINLLLCKMSAVLVVSFGATAFERVTDFITSFSADAWVSYLLGVVTDREVLPADYSERSKNDLLKWFVGKIAGDTPLTLSEERLNLQVNHVRNTLIKELCGRGCDTTPKRIDVLCKMIDDVTLVGA